jgi:hypothetical protein
VECTVSFAVRLFGLVPYMTRYVSAPEVCHEKLRTLVVMLLATISNTVGPLPAAVPEVSVDDCEDESEPSPGVMPSDPAVTVPFGDDASTGSGDSLVEPKPEPDPVLEVAPVLELELVPVFVPELEVLVDPDPVLVPDPVPVVEPVPVLVPDPELDPDPDPVLDPDPDPVLDPPDPVLPPPPWVGGGATGLLTLTDMEAVAELPPEVVAVA